LQYQTRTTGVNVWYDSDIHCTTSLWSTNG